MSAIQMIIANIQLLNDTDRAQVLGHFAVASTKSTTSAKDVGATKDLEPKKQNANKGKPTCYSDFAKKVMGEQKEAITAFKLANPEIKGAHLIFVGSYKKEHPEEFTAFEAAWKEAHPKAEPVAKEDVEPEASETASVAGAKPKRVMTDEQKAKMKAGREASANAKKAKKEADATRVVAVSTAAELMGHGEVPDEIAALTVALGTTLKKRGPKKLEDMTPEERATHDSKKAERQAKKASGTVNDKAAGRPTVDTDSASDVSVPSAPRSTSPKLKDD